MESKKIKLGQFFTKATLWLKPQVEDFIKRSGCTIAYDPFAGGGDLLNAVTAYFDKKISSILSVLSFIATPKNILYIVIRHYFIKYFFIF